MKRVKNVFFAIGIIVVAGFFINAANKNNKTKAVEATKEVLKDTSFVKDYNFRGFNTCSTSLAKIWITFSHG